MPEKLRRGLTNPNETSKILPTTSTQLPRFCQLQLAIAARGYKIERSIFRGKVQQVLRSFSPREFEWTKRSSRKLPTRSFLLLFEKRDTIFFPSVVGISFLVLPPSRQPVSFRTPRNGIFHASAFCTSGSSPPSPSSSFIFRLSKIDPLASRGSSAERLARLLFEIRNENSSLRFSHILFALLGSAEPFERREC